MTDRLRERAETVPLPVAFGHGVYSNSRESNSDTGSQVVLLRDHICQNQSPSYVDFKRRQDVWPPSYVRKRKSQKWWWVAEITAKGGESGHGLKFLSSVSP